MTQWFSQFDYPGLGGWLDLPTHALDGAERAAQEVADREGERMHEYAEAVYPELKVIWEGMRERRAAPVVVYVPPVPLSTRPLVPVSAYVQARKCLPEERTVEAITELVSSLQPDRFGEAEITAVTLPAGPACRVQEVLMNDAGDDERRFMIEHIDYYVLPPECPEGMFKFSVTWSSFALGPDMTDTTDVMAASLRIEKRG
ncbi:hypothetical protein [Streptomyces litchfieldiae]|uniref:Uncharacterized protein n=1 Tax=Streptomyces litchfieldiae TaxID=3075543 RepID=A0ABU2MUV7_9ACTN|nr:hypothetical protein [Streptomyces sp. DSM 44938]MDT0345345.1 hypothetical protein [Streptomyces sp. DSM 44938]